MKKKYIGIGLALAFVLGLVACGGQQAQEPEQQEPSQEVQQTEPISTEPTTPPVETEPQDEPKASEVPEVTEPVEDETVEDETGDGEGESVEPAPSTAPVPVETPKQETPKPAETKPVQTAPPAVSSDDVPNTEPQQDNTQTTTLGTSNGDGWNQSFYDTLNDQQKAVYEGLDAAGRTNMQSVIEADRKLDEQGYSQDLDTSSVKEEWSHIHVTS